MSYVSLKQVNLANLTNTAMTSLTCDDNGKVLMDGEEVVDLSEFGSSLATSGWQKLPSGLIIQWGVTADVGTNTESVVTFPIAFPTACLSGWATIARKINTNEGLGTSFSSPTLTQAVVVHYSSISSSASKRWFAIGY